MRDVQAPVRKAQIQKNAIGKENIANDQFQNVAKVGKSLPSKTTRYAEFEESEVMISSYDLQSNSNVANRLASFADGDLSFVCTFMPAGTSPFTQASGYRGTGYNHYTADEGWGEMPDGRFEGITTGWPSIAPYGPNGEIAVSHNGGNGLVCYTRENKGQGDWNGPISIPSMEGHSSVSDTPFASTWARIATTGPDHTIVHIVCADQDTNGDGETNIFYVRSTDLENWTVSFFPELNNNGANQYSADDYCIAAKGNTVAVLFVGGFSYQSDVLLVKSTDNGENWEKTVVWQYPFPDYGDWNDAFVFDTMHHTSYSAPSMGSLALDNNGNAHVALTAMAVKPSDQEGYYSYYFGLSADGVFYWKEGDEPFTTGPVLPDGTSDPYLALAPMDYYPTGEYNDEGEEIEEDVLNERWIAGAVIGVHNDGHYMDYNQWRKYFKANPDITEEELEVDFVSEFPGFNSYSSTMYGANSSDLAVNGNYAGRIGAGCMVGWPSITVDDNGIVAIAYSVPDWRREADAVNNAQYRAVYITYIDHGVIYPNEEYVAEEFAHTSDEMTNVTALPNSYGDRKFVFGYMCDTELGWTGQDNEDAAHGPVENTMYVTIVTPRDIIDEVKEAVNPMNGVSVRPNPASETLYLDINAGQAANMTATVYNITGQKVMEQDMTIATGINTRSINVSNLTSGIYFVTVKANGFEETKKFVVK